MYHGVLLIDGKAMIADRPPARLLAGFSHTRRVYIVRDAGRPFCLAISTAAAWQGEQVHN